MPSDTIKNMIKGHEGFSRVPYKCPAGYLTIGWGHNIEDKGLSENICEAILDEDISEAEETISIYVPNYEEFSENRQATLIDMAFNMGRSRFGLFRRMLVCLKGKDFEGTAREMEDSLWYNQVSSRARKLVKMMREG